MTADQIRDAINDEVHNLSKDGKVSTSIALENFSRSASNAELIRFRELLIAEDQGDWFNDPNNVASHHHY